MRSHDTPAGPPQTAGLEHAFDRFTQVSGQLIDAYLALQQQVSHLSEQLALANEQLSRRVAENTALLGRLSLLLNMLPAGVIEIDAGNMVAVVEPGVITIGATYMAETFGAGAQATGTAGLNVLTSEPSRRVVGKVRAEDGRIISGGMKFRVRQQ